jgi:PadR family transcriptional regulator AphA
MGRSLSFTGRNSPQASCSGVLNPINLRSSHDQYTFTCGYSRYLNFRLILAIYIGLVYYMSCPVSTGGWGMSLEHAILGFLNVEPRSGYDLKTRCFDVEAKAFWNADQAQIYRTLERLNAAHLVKATRRRQSGKPDRKIYEITQAGREAFASWETAAAPISPQRDAFLLQVYFAGDVSDDGIVALLSDRRAAHQARLHQLRDEAVELSRNHSLPARIAAMRQAAYDGAIATERATIDWLDDILEAISDGLLPGSEISEPGTQDPLFGWAPA